MDEEAFDSKLSWLIECFPDVDVELLVEAVFESDGLEQNAVDHVLARTIDGSMDTPDNFQVSKSVTNLMISFPAVPVDTLAAFVAAHPAEDDLDVLSSQLILHLQTQPPLLNTGTNRKRQRNVTVTHKVFASAKPPRDHSGQHSQTSSSSSPATNLYGAIIGLLEGALDSVPHETAWEEPQDLRNQVLELHRERVALYRRAAEAHQRGGLTGTLSAQYYSAQAATMKRAMDQLSGRAAYWTFRNYNADPRGLDVVDLHGLTVSEVLPIVDIIFHHRRQTTSPTPVKIVVGAGRHSVSGARLGPAVWQRLTELGASYTYDGHAVFTL